MENKSLMYIESEGSFLNKEINIKKQTELNKLIEEYNIVISNKDIYINRNDILRDIYLTVNNRIEIDCFITDKMEIRRKKGEEGCCNLF
jgi:hypothetical protein